MSNIWAVIPEGDNIEKRDFFHLLLVTYNEFTLTRIVFSSVLFSFIQENLPEISGTAHKKKTTYDLLLSKGVSVSIFGMCYFEGLPGYCSLVKLLLYTICDQVS